MKLTNTACKNAKPESIHSQNIGDGAEFFAKSIGTRTDVEPTVQIGEDGVTGMGSIREVQEFLVHPNQLKKLSTGEAYIKRDNLKKPVSFVQVRYSQILY